MKAKPYYTLAVREEDGVWTAQFGDYDKNVVKDEMWDSWLDCGADPKDLKIIVSDDDQIAINGAIADLNK